MRRDGFSIVEMLIVVSIFAVIGAIVTIALSRYTRAQVIASAATTIISTLDDARSRTLSSRAESQYGVHLESGSIVLFKGDTYDALSVDNETTIVDTRATITPTLNGGGSDIVFKRLTGETNNYGTVLVSLASDASSSQSISISQTGLTTYNE